jgi:hypothetical protein
MSQESFVEYFKTDPVYDIPRVKTVKEPPLNLSTIMFLRDKEIPKFAFLVFDQPYISASEKRIFANDFLRRYMEDSEFRKENDGKYIVFLNKKYYGVVNSIVDSWNIGKQSDSRLIMKIGKLTPINQFSKTNNVCSKD